MLKVRVVETLLYGCTCRRAFSGTTTRSCAKPTIRYSAAASVGANRIMPDQDISYRKTLARTGCERIETTVRRRRILFTGLEVPMEKGRLPKHVMSINSEIKDVAGVTTFIKRRRNYSRSSDAMGHKANFRINQGG